MNEKLFQAQVLHSYFSNGIFQNCQLIADSDTKKIMARYGLFTIMNDGVFSFYTTARDGAVALVKYLNDQLRGEPLKFLLTSNANQFVSITELPLDWVGQVLFSTKSGEQSNAETVRLEPVLADRVVNQHNVIGVISIYLNDLLAMNCKNIHYVIDFQARAMHWVYYLINRSQTRLNEPMIRNKQQFFFEGPEPVVLSNGEKGLSFSSGETQFPLQEIPTMVFDLVDRQSPSLLSDDQPVEHDLIQGLPTPNAGQFEVRQADVKKYVFSAMYVYL